MKHTPSMESEWAEWIRRQAEHDRSKPMKTVISSYGNGRVDTIDT